MCLYSAAERLGWYSLKFLNTILDDLWKFLYNTSNKSDHFGRLTTHIFNQCNIYAVYGPQK